jgi:hypothetical protein
MAQRTVPLGTKVRITEHGDTYHGCEGVVVERPIAWSSTAHYDVAVQLDTRYGVLGFNFSEITPLKEERPQDAPTEEQKDAIIEALTKKAEDALTDKSRLERMLKAEEAAHLTTKELLMHYTALYRVQVGINGAVQINYYTNEGAARFAFDTAKGERFMDQRSQPGSSWNTVRSQW